MLERFTYLLSLKAKILLTGVVVGLVVGGCILGFDTFNASSVTHKHKVHLAGPPKPKPLDQQQYTTANGLAVTMAQEARRIYALSHHGDLGIDAKSIKAARIEVTGPYELMSVGKKPGTHTIVVKNTSATIDDKTGLVTDVVIGSANM